MSMHEGLCLNLPRHQAERMSFRAVCCARTACTEIMHKKSCVRDLSVSVLHSKHAVCRDAGLAWCRPHLVHSSLQCTNAHGG